MPDNRSVLNRYLVLLHHVCDETLLIFPKNLCLQAGAEFDSGTQARRHLRKQNAMSLPGQIVRVPDNLASLSGKMTSTARAVNLSGFVFCLLMCIRVNMRLGVNLCVFMCIPMRIQT